MNKCLKDHIQEYVINKFEVFFTKEYEISYFKIKIDEYWRPCLPAEVDDYFNNYEIEIIKITIQMEIDKEEDQMKEERKCSKCHKPYKGTPAISRRNNQDICPACGMTEAMEDWLIAENGGKN